MDEVAGLYRISVKPSEYENLIQYLYYNDIDVFAERTETPAFSEPVHSVYIRLENGDNLTLHALHTYCNIKLVVR